MTDDNEVTPPSAAPDEGSPVGALKDDDRQGDKIEAVEPARGGGPPESPEKATWVTRALEWVEVVGNKLPDPAVLFLIGLILTWVASALLSGVTFSEIDPRTGQAIVVNNQLTGAALASFLAGMVNTFVTFHPLGVVLVALLGVGVIFYAAGRHPLAGIAAAFAGVSGGFSANFIPSGIDPLLQGLTQASAQILDPAIEVNPLCNILFTGASTVLVVLVGWFITDKIIEPRLADTPVELDEGDEIPQMESLSASEKKGLWAGIATTLALCLVLVAVVLPPNSPLRAPNGEITAFAAPLMQSIVPLIFLFFIIPGIVYGYVAGTVKNHRDIIEGMSRAMKTMGYYIVMAFFAALFIQAFALSNIGALIALKGAAGLQALGWPAGVTIVGIVLLTAMVNLLVGSASAKWALLSPIFVPMLMQLGISPELTQAAYRVGDSTTNIITPLMPYFPLIVVFCQRWYKKTGIGTLVSLMLPYSVVFLVLWSLFLLAYWGLGLPLGINAPYVYPAP